MALVFNDAETTYADPYLFKSTQKSVELMAKAYAPQSVTNNITGIELRMLPPFIDDNRTPKIWPFPGYADLYCLTIVVSDVANELAGLIDLKGFHRINDREHLPINKTLFYWDKEGSEKVPQQIHVMSTVIKSKKGLRNVGEVLAGLKSNDNYKNLVQELAQIVSDVANYNVIIGIITELAGIVGGLLGKVEDRPLGTVINSFTAVYGELNKIGSTPYHFPTRNVEFNYHLVVRDADVNIEGEKMDAPANTDHSSAVLMFA